MRQQTIGAAKDLAVIHVDKGKAKMDALKHIADLENQRKLQKEEHLHSGMVEKFRQKNAKKKGE